MSHNFKQTKIPRQNITCLIFNVNINNEQQYCSLGIQRYLKPRKANNQEKSNFTKYRGSGLRWVCHYLPLSLHGFYFEYLLLSQNGLGKSGLARVGCPTRQCKSSSLPIRGKLALDQSSHPILYISCQFKVNFVILHVFQQDFKSPETSFFMHLK